MRSGVKKKKIFPALLAIMIAVLIMTMAAMTEAGMMVHQIPVLTMEADMNKMVTVQS